MGETPLLRGPWKKYRANRVEQVAKAMYESARHEFPAVQIFDCDEIQRFLRKAINYRPD
jgi:hypothetical protein